ncbi:hypothetical protein GCM10009642_06520 [Nocardiopsis metallicus]
MGDAQDQADPGGGEPGPDEAVTDLSARGVPHGSPFGEEGENGALTVGTESALERKWGWVTENPPTTIDTRVG